jgi:hypothetical protein
MSAPVALFVYNRPEHTRQTLEALARNERASDTHLIVYSDGPKTHADPAELERIEAVRKILRSRNWCGKTEVVEAPTNKGLQASLIGGITEVLAAYGRAIILEDDILCHPNFLDYCHQGLERYERFESVMQIGAYMFPSRTPLPETFFSTAVFIWGWATWKRAWDHYSPDAAGQLQRILDGGGGYAFDLHGAYAYTELLRRQAEGKISTWDICWNASVFLRKGITLNPGISLTENIGFDGTGTHWTAHGRKTASASAGHRAIRHYPDEVSVSTRDQRRMENAVFDWYHPSRRARWAHRLRQTLGMQS